MEDLPMFSHIRISFVLTAAFIVTLSASELFAQNRGNDNRQEYVRSSSPTKNGGRVISESVGGRRMVRIARAPETVESTNAAETGSTNERGIDRNISESSGRSKYSYPDRSDAQQVTAFRQAANQPPQLRFPPNNQFPTQNRMAQCNCNGIPVPPQQLQYNPQNYSAGFQGQAGFPPPQGFGNPPNVAYPIQPGIGVPQFNQTGGNWWSPFISGSGYYTPLLNFRNMPQGTYLGQGIIGQPTAYVDGQPFRNLLRYVSP